MLIRTFDLNKRIVRASTNLLAVSIACASASLAYPQEMDNLGPADILPLIFTPLEDPHKFQRRTGPIAKVDDKHAEEDLDLALDNFFYALDDLIQSASRHSETQAKSESHFVQLVMPNNVVATLHQPTKAINLPPTSVAENSDNDSVFDNFALASQLNFAVAHNSNIYTTRDNEVSDQIANFRGMASLESKTRKNSLKFDAGVIAASYLENTDDNYIDFNANASYTTLFSLRSKLFAGLNYSSNHEERGSGITEDTTALSLSEPIEFDSTVARALYEKGTNQTRSRLSIDARKNWIRTKNFQDIEAVRQRDRDINAIVGTAFYNLSQRMSVLVELRHQDISYLNNPSTSSADSTQTRYAIGAEWLATRKTAGSVRIGIQDKDFDDLGNDDFQGLSWDAIVEWAPAPRTEMIFETSADITESEGFGVSREGKDYKITWKQRWSPRINSTASTQYSTTDYQQDTREDDLTLLNAELTYSLGTKTDASIKMTYIDNHSNITEFSFDRALIQLGLELEL